ncbi:MAG: FAD-dependent oxidoreductase [Clostridia bacterium]|nr:FAD-dependent oxidoreductase [Clostridia bacterium]
MKKEYKPLFSPWKIGNVEIKNRIVLCPMGGTSLFGWMMPSKFNKESAKFILERAKNNVGLIIPGIAPVKDLILRRWLYQNKKMFKELKSFMEEFHKTGAKLFVQLTAGFGRSFSVPNAMVSMLKSKVVNTLVKPIIDVRYLSASPSVVPSRWAEGTMCRQISVKEIKEIIYAFGETARLCKEAGVDGVEVHAVHEGYLLDQFTTKYTNFRTDEYGGSFENRYRFATDIVKEIKAKCGLDFPVSLRYSVTSKTKGFCEGALPGEKFTEAGRNMKESEKAIKHLEEAGYDMFNCDNGTYDAWYWAHPPGYMPENCNLEDVAHIKQFTTMPVVCAGRMNPKTGAKAIKENQIDAMGVARQFLVDPEWITKLMEDREDEIMPCICCHNACFTMAHYKGVANDQPLEDSSHMARCALNPQTMQSKKYKIIPTKKPKNIAVVGGGIGGMEVARILTLRGHKVTIYEKTKKLGGVFIPAAAPSFKEKDKALIEWFKKQIKKLNIKVKFETEITSLESLGADEIIIATGAKPRKLNLPGFEKAIDAVDYLNGKKVGEKVAVIGGGLTGCEVAYDLFLKGKKPTIIEMKNDLIATSGVCLANSSYLRDFFKLNKVPVFLESSAKELKGKKLTIMSKDKEKTIDVDSVVLSIGYNPAPIAQKSKHVHIVGDANSVGNLRTVIWKAWDVAMKI